ncbi:MAG: ABC transporter substrate-binding protein [Pseudomonadota bacterium]
MRFALKKVVIKKIAFGFLLSGLIFCLICCSRSPEDKRIQITIWYPFGGLTGQFFNKLITEYENSHPQIDIKPVYTGGYSITARKVITGIATGILPEGGVIPAAPLFTGRTGNYRIQEYLNNSRDLNKDDIYPVLWDFNKFRNRICSLPFANSTPILYYNKDLLRKAGFNPQQSPETWQQLEDMAKEISCDKNNDGNIDVWGVVISNEDWILKSMIVQNGGQIIDSSSQKPLFNSAEAVEIMAFWQELVKKKLMPPAMHSRARAQFLGGRAAFLLATSGMVKTFIEAADFEFGVAFVPKFNPENPYTVTVGGVSLALFPSEPVKEQTTWDFFCWLLSEEVVSRWVVQTGYVPIRKSALKSDLIQQLFSTSPQYQAAFEQIAYAQTYLHFWQMGGMDEYLRSAIVEVELGVASPKQVLDKAVRNLLNDIQEE